MVAYTERAGYCSFATKEQLMSSDIYIMEDTIIHKNDRICQFRIQKIQPEIEFSEVEHLDSVSRGGIGSTGKA